MTTINDAILSATGGPTINEGLSTWFTRTTAEALQDAERRWLDEQGVFQSSQLNDMWFAFLRSQGFTGALSDMLLTYWLFQIGLGPELVVNGAFGVDTTGWTGESGGILSAPAGELIVTKSTVANAYASQQLTLPATGTDYRFQGTGAVGTAANCHIRMGTTQNGSQVFNSGDAPAHTIDAVVVPGILNPWIRLGAQDPGSVETANFDNISVRRILV